MLGGHFFVLARASPSPSPSARSTTPSCWGVPHESQVATPGFLKRVKTMASSLRSVVLGLALALCGCTISVSPDQAKALPSENLCSLHAYNSKFGPDKAQATKEELLRRQVISNDDWNAISARSLRVGMSRLALICVMGNPYSAMHGKINTTVTGGLKSEQFVYYPSPSSGPVYVYVKNGEVTGWQF